MWTWKKFKASVPSVVLEEKDGRIIYKDNLTYYGCDLPENLTIEGYLDIDYRSIEQLPKGLIIKGDLYARYSKLKKLPDDIFIKGDIYLENSEIEELPDNFTVNGELNISYTHIKKLPKNLTVRKRFDAHNSLLESFPEDTKIYGSICLSGTNITYLPENLEVLGNLEVSYSTIKKLPKGLIIKDDLYAAYTSLTSFPSDISVGGCIILHHSKIKKLPKDLDIVKGSLDLSYTPVNKLPDNLVVTEDLDVCNTPLESLPEGLIVGRHITYDTIIKNTELFELVPRSIYHITRKMPSDKGICIKTNKKGTFVIITSHSYIARVIKNRGNIYHVDELGCKGPAYLLTDDKGNWEYGYDYREAKLGLMFKTSKKQKEDYKNLTLGSSLTFKEALLCYHTITGACFSGICEFLKRLPVRKNNYTIWEIIDLTKYNFGNIKFAMFFTNNN